MRKIASPQELQTEIRRLLSYAQSEKPSRERVATALRELATRVATWDADGKLKCDMEADCKEPVTHADRDGYVYCAKHAERRNAYKRTRKLRPAEIKKMEQEGKARIEKYGQP